MQFIKEITALETFSVRQLVLRPGKSIDTCHFDGDNLDSTHHFGLFVDEKLAGITSLFQEKTDLLTQNNQFQLRGMAVLEEFQKKGIGESLLKYAEENAKSRGAEIIWFNAREIAVGFYEKIGYQIIGAPFNIRDIGTHFVMHKKIN